MARLVASEPTPGQVIREIHAWIAHYVDGTEGIIAAGLPGIGMTTLTTSRRNTAEAMRHLAEEAMAMSRLPGSGVKVAIRSVSLVTFKRTEDA